LKKKRSSEALSTTILAMAKDTDIVKALVLPFALLLELLW
jgi:hypothetical protein